LTHQGNTKGNKLPAVRSLCESSLEGNTRHATVPHFIHVNPSLFVPNVHDLLRPLRPLLSSLRGPRSTRTCFLSSSLVQRVRIGLFDLQWPEGALGSESPPPLLPEMPYRIRRRRGFDEPLLPRARLLRSLPEGIQE
jgi:hypothetical protein